MKNYGINSGRKMLSFVATLLLFCNFANALLENAGGGGGFVYWTDHTETLTRADAAEFCKTKADLTEQFNLARIITPSQWAKLQTKLRSNTGDWYWTSGHDLETVKQFVWHDGTTTPDETIIESDKLDKTDAKFSCLVVNGKAFGVRPCDDGNFKAYPLCEQDISQKRAFLGRGERKY